MGTATNSEHSKPVSVECGVSCLDKPFFIMLNSQHGTHIMPIVDSLEQVMLFRTEAEARELAENHTWCQAFGYEIFERGTGS